MIELFINKLPADLPADFSFSMEYENEFFTKASEYSLDIELPLMGSPNNQKIFGNIHRVTTPKSNVNFEAVAYVNGRCVAHGYAIILAVTATSVKVQLVGNTSYVNYFTTDTYIDEMDLGFAETPRISELTYANLNRLTLPKTEFYKAFGSVDDTDMVFFWSFCKDPKDLATSFPSTPPFYHYYPNHPFPSFGGSSESRFYLYDLEWYSLQPYLLKVIDRLVNSMGFKIRRNDVNQTWLRNLYICNTKPSNRRDWANEYANNGSILRMPMQKALPHWTVATFIDEVEKLCACIFLFNTYNKTVDIVQLDKFYADTAEVYEVPDDCILDEYEFEFSDDESDKDLATGNVSFAKDYTDKFLKFSEEVRDTIATHNHYDDYAALKTAYDGLSVSARQEVLFVDDATGREYICCVDEDGNDEMLEVNIWADLTRDDGGSGDVSLKIVPADTRMFGVGWWFDEYQKGPSAGLDLHIPFSVNETTDPEYTTAQDIIENSYSSAQKDESNDCMEVMLSTGEWYHLATYGGTNFQYPAPFADFNMPGSGKGKFPEMSLSLKDVCEQSLGHMYRNIPSYRSDQKFVFRFLAKSVPDARQPFRFHNQLYVCRKLNADFANAAKDLIFEGEFYRLE